MGSSKRKCSVSDTKESPDEEQNESKACPAVFQEQDSPHDPKPERSPEAAHSPDTPPSPEVQGDHDRFPTNGHRRGNSEPKRCMFQIEPFHQNNLDPSLRDSSLHNPTLRKMSSDMVSMEPVYIVRPNVIWKNLIRYKEVVVDGEKYRLNDKIFANPSNAAASIGDRNLSQSLFQTSHPIVGDDRVAQIIEIKGKDAEHVYLRVLWLYTPDDLPAGGRKSYHGKHELIASNHMSIIDASDMSVLGHVSVSHWEEDETEDPKPGLFWRQTFDVPMEELSSLKAHCAPACDLPSNPDKALIPCADCHTRYHTECVLKAHQAMLAARPTFGRLPELEAVRMVQHQNGKFRVIVKIVLGMKQWEETAKCLGCGALLA